MPHIYSVAVFVTDIDRALLFYRDHLGLPLLHQGSFGAEFLEGRDPTRRPSRRAPQRLVLVGRETGITFHVKTSSTSANGCTSAG